MNSALVFDEKGTHEKGFAEHFEQRIKPKLLEIDHARRAALAVFYPRRSRTIHRVAGSGSDAV